MTIKTATKRPLPTSIIRKQLQRMPWHAAAEFALSANRVVTFVGEPGCGKTMFANHWALQHTGLPAFERQGNPSMNEQSLWGRLHLNGASTVARDGRLAAAIQRGGVFVLNDASVVPHAALSSLLDVAENDVVHNPNTDELMTVPESFRIVLTTNRESLRCRQGKATFHSMRSRSLVLHVDSLKTEVLVQILRADFPTMSRGQVERAITNWERFNPIAVKGDSDDDVFRLSIREAWQYLNLIRVGAGEAMAVRLAFVDKFCHDPEAHDAMLMKQGLSAEDDA